MDVDDRNSEIKECKDRVYEAKQEFKTAIKNYRKASSKKAQFILEKRAPLLPQEALKNAEIYNSRNTLLEDLPKNKVIAEVGTQYGAWAKKILKTCDPAELHLFDRKFNITDPSVTNSSCVVTHEGDSSTNLSKVPDSYFDWIYIDGDHSYKGVKKDIEQAVKKVKRDGILVFNDYITWSPLEVIPYGVVTAVNELILDGWEMVALALSPHAFWDVAVRRM